MPAMLRMRWVDLAFLHWRVPVAVLRPLVPADLEIDTFQNEAWVGVIPFLMTNVRPAMTPPIPTANEFPELNVRTYVRNGGHAGVYFFSLDAGSALAVIGARITTGLPYFYARMNVRRDGDDVLYESGRLAGPTAGFRARYRPAGTTFRSEPGSLEHFLTERYSLFVTHLGRLRRLGIEHEPWQLQRASADIVDNTMARAPGIALPPDPPHVLFSQTLDVVANWPSVMAP